MICDKEPYISSGGGTTNITGITWTQRGNTVDVKAVDLSSLDVNTNYSITSMPKPINANNVLYPVLGGNNSSVIVGYIIYLTNISSWRIRLTSSDSNYKFCCFTYLTDE